MKKVFEPVAKSINDVSEDVTKTMTETSKENNKAVENLGNKLLEIMNDRVTLASYILYPLCKTINPEHISQLKLTRDPQSIQVNDLLIKKKQCQ